MTDTIEPVILDEEEKQAPAWQLVDHAKAEGVDQIRSGVLLPGMTKQVLVTALQGEISEHLGHDKQDPGGRLGGNSRNGTRSKTVMTEVMPVELAVLRDRDGTFEPKIVQKRQRRLVGRSRSHFADVYDAEVGKEAISRIISKVVEKISAWQTRPLDLTYPVI